MNREYRTICLTIAEGVAHVRLNQPEKLNTLGIGPGSNREELCQAFADADADPAVGCILLSGEGRAFCAGGDLGGTVEDRMPADDALVDAYLFNDAMNQFYAQLRSIKKPVIAAVQGYCLGAGLGLAAQCDLLIAADDARFGLIEARIGHPGAVELLPTIGRQWTKFLILTGEIIDAETAHDIGLALTVIPADMLLDRALDLSRRIARMPRHAVMLNKGAVDKAAEAGGDAAGRVAGRSQDVMTKYLSQIAEAPDGRRFSDILRTEGMTGLKAARETQYSSPWLNSFRRPRR